MNRRNHAGFSLLHVTVIVAVLGGLAATLYPLFHPHSTCGKQPQCLSNQKHCAIAMIQYSGDFDGILPASSRWMDEIHSYGLSERDYHDLAVPTGEYGYAFRKSASSLDTDKLESPASFILEFESNRKGRSASADLSALLRVSRHGPKSGVNVAFADGHVRSLSSPGGIVSIEDALVADRSAGPKP